MSLAVLVADDDPLVRKALLLLFGDSCLVLEAATGEEALRIIDAHKPRLVLLDMVLPGMSGLEVLQAAREAVAGMTVIMLTGQSDVELAKRALELGADEFITKPFDWGHLREKVTRAMGGVPGGGRGGRGFPWRAADGMNG